jgi:archaellum component FlaC
LIWGRGITRDTLKGKDDQIRELDDRIERLEKEVEMNRDVT